MKVTVTDKNGLVKVSTEDNRMEVTIDATTGGIIDLYYSESSIFNKEVTIQELAAFISKARTKFNRHNVKEELNDLVIGGE